MEENKVVVPITKYEILVANSREMEMVCQLLKNKLTHYQGLTLNEIRDLCTMLGIEPEEEE